MDIVRNFLIHADQQAMYLHNAVYCYNLIRHSSSSIASILIRHEIQRPRALPLDLLPDIHVSLESPPPWARWDGRAMITFVLVGSRIMDA